MAKDTLTIKQERFAQEYFATGNASEAYRRAYDAKGMKQTTIETTACGTLKVPKVAARINELRQKAMEASTINGAEVIRHLAEIAIADPNELVTHRRINCRYCNGIDFRYQWKHEGEFAHAMDLWEEESIAWDEKEQARAARAQTMPKSFKKPMPTDDGGYGFRRTGELNKACPRCEGEGVDEIFIADTGKLQGPARRLYAGVKQTKNGIEVAMHSQDNARKLLGEHFGLFKMVLEGKFDNKNENTNVNVDANDIADKDALIELLKKRGLPTTVFDKRDK